jgi:hypothetical protein
VVADAPAFSGAVAARGFAGSAAFGAVPLLALAADAVAGLGAAFCDAFAGSLAGGGAALAETTGLVPAAVAGEEPAWLGVGLAVEASAPAPRVSRMVSGRTLSTFGMALTSNDFFKY